MSDVVIWLTYDELSERLRITRESARQLVIRKRWTRQKGNDAKTRVGVPEEALQSRVSDDTSHDTPPDTSSNTINRTSDEASVIPVLTRHIERIEKELQTLTAKLECVVTERDAERQRANELAVQAAAVEPLKMTIEALKQSLGSEKHRVNELREQRDRLADRLTTQELRGGFITRLRKVFG